MLLKMRPVLLVLLTLFFVAINGHAAPSPKITDWKVDNEQFIVTITDSMGKRQVIAESSGMKNFLSEPQAMIVGGGHAIIYQAPGTAKSGFEGETQAVKRFDVDGIKATLLDEPLNVFRIRKVETNRTTLYVVSMQDGGAGIPSLYLIHSMAGVLWKKSAARMTGARNGKLIVAFYPEGEEAGYPDAKPVGTIYLDLERLLDHTRGFGFG